MAVLAILDTKPLTTGSLPPAECARPGLHEFLELIYPFYDSESCYDCLTVSNPICSMYMVRSKFINSLELIGEQVPNELGLVRNQACRT